MAVEIETKNVIQILVEAEKVFGRTKGRIGQIADNGFAGKMIENEVQNFTRSPALFFARQHIVNHSREFRGFG